MSKRPLAFAWLAAAVITLAAGEVRAQPAPLAPGLAAQIRALQQEKAARSPAQRKVGSQLLYEARMQRGLPVAPGVTRLHTGVGVDAAGRTLVDLRAEPTKRLRAEIAALGGEIQSEVPSAGAFRVWLPLDAVEDLAASPDVIGIHPAGRAMTRATNVSEGDVAHRADEARSTYGVDGTGITIGVLSDGVDSLASLQASGDLPAGVTVITVNVNGQDVLQDGSGSEGTAMLEIVTDLAPGANLLFATAFNSQASFAANILALRTAGADVIVDDVAYFAEGMLQDDDVAAAVDSVVADGALYFSAAGNEGNLNDGTAGVWEGDFVDSGEDLSGDPVHDFGGGDFLNEITVDTPFGFTLHWSDPLLGSSNDYDLYLVNKPGTVIFGAGTDVQDGDDDPYEQIGVFGNNTGRNLLIVRASGAANRYLHLNANRGEFEYTTFGQTGQHAGARGALGVAAVDVDDAAGAGGVFAGTESVETYSSDGPRRVFYEADGTPITPGDFSSAGGELRAKPDLAAADCVSTATPGFSTFCGTSAAAPHAAAIAALLLELGATPTEARDALTGTALDIEASGPDRDSGAGIIEALAAATDVAPAACENGVDDDADGLTDDLDPGCDDPSDDSERSDALPCDDGADNDSDGFVDHSPTPGAGDPGCQSPSGAREDPQCQDGVNNDPGQDALIDFDGGASAGLPLEQQTDPDPQCVDQPGKNREALPSGTGGCGIGPELLLLGLALQRLRRGPPARRLRR
ncbi:MAG: S8 family serine peptidase [Myxococcota bacterium]